MNDLGNPNAVPMDKATYDRLRETGGEIAPAVAPLRTV